MPPCPAPAESSSRSFHRGWSYSSSCARSDRGGRGGPDRRRLGSCSWRPARTTEEHQPRRSPLAGSASRPPTLLAGSGRDGRFPAYGSAGGGGPDALGQDGRARGAACCRARGGSRPLRPAAPGQDGAADAPWGAKPVGISRHASMSGGPRGRRRPEADPCSCGTKGHALSALPPRAFRRRRPTRRDRRRVSMPR